MTQDDAIQARVRALPGTLTYLDLIKRNKRDSALLMAIMLVFGAGLGAAIAAALAADSGVDLMPSLILGALAALAVGGIAAAWSWRSGASAILRLSGARELAKAQDPELFNVVEEVSIAAGLPMPRVYLIEDSAMNAFATGRDSRNGVVCITRGLRQRLTRDELQGVMAHEMSHIRHLDIRFAMLMATMVGLIVFACDAMRRVAFYGPARRSRGKGGGGAAVLMIVALLLSILAPIFARLIQMAYSRQREFLADAGSVELTRNPLGLASALRKLAEDDEPLVDAANRGTAHMFIVNPLRKMRLAHQSLDSMFCSHPPIQERVARLMALAR